ncbi:MTRF1L release factor glutamine methyltransferase-like isoform X2 [Leptopilina heterotoma]|uniref:MTRF1L release factor glutamine methyltransferase-like isoform X2 n=1 Tax=Leptopilina heterotoma TaxID=63436 RepID=UPI001CA80CC1|nr:MTRF1L release factor glutamine methyltransferase-like isoform X2 [Leptopilina heterotoma]
MLWTIGIKDFKMRKFLNQLNRLNTLSHMLLAPKRMPIQYIIGNWDFRDITIKLIPPIFIPRPETEILVDFVLKRISTGNYPDFSCDILEIGCGSGAISLSILQTCKKLKILAIDTNKNACNLTLENAQNLKLDDRLTVINATLQEDGTIKNSSQENSLDFKEKTFDFIISNPPYVSTKQVFRLMPEIKLYEDVRALDGGEDGLKVIKPLLHYSAKALKPGGRLFIEIDPAHSEYIQFFTAKYNELKLKYEHTYKDFSNYDRFVEVLKI